MIGSVELITPTMAAAMLETNTRNRHLSRSAVHRFAVEMRAGRWNTNGQGIIFSLEGELLDGQHRLEAVIESGIAVEMFVVRGVPRERFETMDSGRVRTTGDVLAAQGFANYNQLAAIARAAFNYISGVNPSYVPSKTVLLEFIYAHPYLNDVTAQVVQAAAPLPNSQLGGVLFVANAGDRRFDLKVDAFLHGLATGADLKKGDARLTLREWAFLQRTRPNGHATAEGALVAIVRAWNAFAQDRELANIKQMANATRKNLPIDGFEQEHFPDVEDLVVRNTEVNIANLAKSPTRGKPEQLPSVKASSANKVA